MAKKGMMDANSKSINKDRTGSSYREVLLNGAVWLCGNAIACLAVYWLTRDVQLSVSIGIIVLACILAGTIRALATEYRIKRRLKEKRNG